MLLCLFGFAPAAQTQRVDLLLNLFIRKKSGSNLEGAVELQTVGDILRSGSDTHLRLHRDRSTQNRRIGLDAQLQKILDAGVIHHHTEFDVVALRIPRANHFAPRRERRMKKSRLHRLKISVAICAVDNGMKIGVQRHRMAARVEPEIGRIGRARNFNLPQAPIIFPRR